MAGTSTSFQNSSNENTSTSTSTPTITPTPQSNWSLQLSQLLSQLGQTEQQWAMSQYARAGQVTDDQINNYIAQAQQGNQMATNLMGRYQDLYGPMEDQYARNAGSYDSLGRIQNEMGAAESRAMQAGKQASDNAERELQAFGIDPSSGRYQDLIRASRTADAAAAASAGETARRAVEAEGDRRRINAIQMGQQLPPAAVNAMNSAYQGIAGAENAALGLANTGANLTTASSKFFDPATRMIQPLQGQSTNSNSQGQGRSAGGSNSVQTGGGGGGGSRTSDPFNSDRFGRGGPQNSSLHPSGGGGPPPGQTARPTWVPNPNGQIIPTGPEVGPEWDPRGTLIQQPGLEGSGPSPWLDEGVDPWNWGAQGDYGNNTGFNPDQLGWNPWSNPEPQAPDWWNQGPNGEPVDTSMQPQGDNWWGTGGQSQTQFPDVPDPSQNWTGQYDYSGLGGGFDYGDTSQYDTGSNYGNDYSQPYDDGSSYNYDNYGSFGDENYGYSSDFAKGGPVPGQRPSRDGRPGGGYVPHSMSPSRGRQTDDIPAVIPQSGGRAQINAGEFVMPRDVVEWKGKEFFQKMIDQSRKRRTGLARS